MLAVNQFRDRFAQTLGSVHCYELREEKYGSHNQAPCSVLVTRAADILLEILDG